MEAILDTIKHILFILAKIILFMLLSIVLLPAFFIVNTLHETWSKMLSELFNA